MRKKVFSIITPTYNPGEKIIKTLNSVVEQEKNLYEYIVVDAKSTDGSIDVIKEYSKKYTNIYYISEPDEGLFDAMNKGIKIANGEYLFFLGAGDTLKRNILIKMKDYLGFDLEIIYGGVNFEKTGYTGINLTDKVNLCFRCLCQQAIFYHYSVFDLIGVFNIRYRINSDYEFLFRCLGMDNIKIRRVNEIISSFEGGGLSQNNKDELFLKDKEEIIQRYLGLEYLKLYQTYKPLNIKWLNSGFIQLLNGKPNVAIFGAGFFGEEVLDVILRCNGLFQTEVNVVRFFDNDPAKWGKSINAIRVFPPRVDLFADIDNIIIASIYGRDDIKAQLFSMGFEPERLVLI